MFILYDYYNTAFKKMLNEHSNECYNIYRHLFECFLRRNIMKETLEKLWNEYFAEECLMIDTDDERALVEKAAEMHEKANELLTKEQIDAIEKYIETLYDIQDFFGKKAFFRGCEFTTAFLFEVGDFGKM